MTSSELPARRSRAGWVRGGASLLAVAAALTLVEGRAEAQSRSAADVAQARDLFLKARDQRDAGDVRGALERFKAAHALSPTPVIDLELGRTYRMAGQLVEAREILLGVARLPVSQEETSHSTQARHDAADLAEQIGPRIPSVSIAISGMPGDSVVVTIDGVVVPNAALVAPRLMNPGVHVIVATAGTARDEARIELREGETKRVELKSSPQPNGPMTARPGPTAVVQAPPPAASPSSTPTVLMGVGFGLAGVGFLVGGITGGLALSKASKVGTACNGLQCPASVSSDLSTGRTMANVSTAMFVVGGAGVVVGVVGVVLLKKSNHTPSDARWVKPWVGPGTAGLMGAF